METSDLLVTSRSHSLRHLTFHLLRQRISKPVTNAAGALWAIPFVWSRYIGLFRFTVYFFSGVDHESYHYSVRVDNYIKMLPDEEPVVTQVLRSTHLMPNC